MRALVLSGGGSRGAFEAGVIKALTEQGARWDVIAGVSVGAINAACMAQATKEEQPTQADKLKQFWDKIEGNKSIYKKWLPLGELHVLWKGSLYNTAPLAATIKKELSEEALRSSGVTLLVGAVCLETGEYKYVTGSTPNIAEWVLASSAFPVMFTPRKIDGLTWVDGGVRDITPITDVLNLKPDEIDVVLTGPLNTPGASTKSMSNGLNVALRTAMLMSDEVFNNDLDRVPEADRAKVRLFIPPSDLKLPDGLDFNPADIKRLYDAGLAAKPTALGTAFAR